MHRLLLTTCLFVAAIMALLRGPLISHAGGETPTPSPSPTPVPALSVAIDCDVALPGVQDACTAPVDAGQVRVDVVLTSNLGGPVDLSSFNFKVINSDLTRLSASAVPCQSPGLNCNPDFNEAALYGSAWGCGPPFATIDLIPGPPQDTFISCFNPSDGPSIPAGVPVTLARVTYDIVGGALTGTVPVALDQVAVYDGSFAELHSCRPVLSNEGACLDASIDLLPPAGGTPTPVTTPTAPPLLTPTPTSAVRGETPTATPTSDYFLAIDCAPTLPGLQVSCSYPMVVTSIEVAVVAGNNTTAGAIVGFDAYVRNDDMSRLLPGVGIDANLDANPDFNDEGLPGLWSCSPPPPEGDTGQGGAGVSVSFLSCVTGLPGMPIGPGLTTLARVRYSVPAATAPATIALGFEPTGASGLVEEVQGPVVDCESQPENCLGASVTLAGPVIEQRPAGNEDNVNPAIPAANLWLCTKGSCGGHGEGDLRVTQRASGVAAGLGSYRLTVGFDPEVIAAIHPCDLVFGPGGAAAARGPVDEIDGSAVNTDCAPDPGGGAPGSCSTQWILQGLVQFACTTPGTAPGATGSFEMSSLLLIPAQQTIDDAFAGVNNGLPTTVQTSSCALADAAGLPAPGSIYGGLAPYCGGVAVTVRTLEGDLNLDCSVDVQDVQAIASRYGSGYGDMSYMKSMDLEPAIRDNDIDIKDVQRVLGRTGSTCQAPIPEQPPAAQ